MTRETIDTKTLRDMLERGEPVTVLDVRRDEDRAEWAIPGSRHIDVYDALRQGRQHVLEGVDLPAGQPVVTVCNAGKTSVAAAEQLRAQGYDARSLEGGMKAWSLAWNTAEVHPPGSEARVIQVRRTGKGCLSYMVVSRGEAVVIDASLDPEVYTELAAHHRVRITGAVDTHLHADHLSRSRQLAELSGAALYAPAGAPVSYPYTPLADGDAIAIGPARLEALRTSGHTRESTSYLLDGRAVFTGDTLFLNAVGRPDLEATVDEARAKARLLYGSIQRLLTLHPETLVLPGHTSEPVPFDGEPIFSPLSAVQRDIEHLLTGEDSFVERVAGRVSPTPLNHERIVQFNRAGEIPETDLSDLEAGANRCAAG